MKEIQLAHNKGVALVDDEYYEAVNCFKWYMSSFGYVKRSVVIKGKHIDVKMHRYIYKLANRDIPVGLEIDHIDRNKLNNCIKNLRLASHRQNTFNKGPKKTSKSGIKGVYLFKNRWRAQIFNNKKIELGYFNSKKDAAEAYNKKAQEIYGSFAFLNDLSKLE